LRGRIVLVPHGGYGRRDVAPFSDVDLMVLYERSAEDLVARLAERFFRDVFDAGLPEPVKRFRAAVAAADGVLIASPEYNFSVSAALKNAIDWASRPPNQVFQDKPIAIFSASAGPMGGARVQYDLRRILGQLWGHVLPRPEVFIGLAPGKFDAQGKLTDETTRKFLSDLLLGFSQWIPRMQKK